MLIKVDIFSGFLGAGKTMLIKKMISEGVYLKDLAIIENEFGEVAIDGEYLKDSGVQIKEIASGCICCSVAGDFKEAILEIIEKYSVKEMIIEPSGVAALSDVLKVFGESIFENKVVLNRVITLVDAIRFEMYYNNFNTFYKNQIQNAKTIVLSRTQHISQEALLQCIKKIKMLNPKAPIVTTPWKELEASMIAQAVPESLEEELIGQVRRGKRSVKRAVTGSPSLAAREVFDSFGQESLSPFEPNKLQQCLNELKNTAKYGEILRAKGIVSNTKGKWFQFDYVTDEYELREVKPYYTSKLCVIGTRLNKEALGKLFEK